MDENYYWLGSASLASGAGTEWNGKINTAEKKAQAPYYERLHFTLRTR
jgi:hypothetical protein